MSSKIKSAEPDEIPVGVGINTGLPVRLCLDRGDHGSAIIVGNSGSGKTFALKTIVKHLARVHDSAQVFIISSFDDYVDVAERCGLDVVSVRDTVPLFGGRVAVALEGRRLDRMNDAKLLVGVLKSAWKRINNSRRDTTKIIVVDDAYLLLKEGEGTKLFNAILRDGKKKNVIFLVADQRADDFESVNVAKFGTFISMQPIEGSDHAAHLREADRERVANFKCGQGVIVTADHCVYTQFG